MAFDDRIDLFNGREKASEIYLAVIFERDLGEDDQGLSEFGNVDLGGITGDKALRLESFDAHQAWARGKVNQLRELDVGNPPILLQFAQNLDVELIKLHGDAIRSLRRGSPYGLYPSPLARSQFVPLGDRRRWCRGSEASSSYALS